MSNANALATLPHETETEVEFWVCGACGDENPRVQANHSLWLCDSCATDAQTLHAESVIIPFASATPCDEPASPHWEVAMEG